MHSSASLPSILRFRAAGFWRRLLSSVVDLMILSPLFALLFIALSFILGASLPNTKELSPDLFLGFLLDRDAHQRILGLSFLLMSVIVIVLYEFIFHVMLGYTLGERFAGITVINKYGERPGLWQSFIRALMGFLAFALAGIGLLWIGFDQKKRGLHDWASKTYSVRTPKNKR